MSPARTVPDSLDALSRELGEVEWFGRRDPRSHPLVLRAPSSVDLLLTVLGAVIGAALYLLASTS